MKKLFTITIYLFLWIFLIPTQSLFADNSDFWRKTLGYTTILIIVVIIYALKAIFNAVKKFLNTTQPPVPSNPQVTLQNETTNSIKKIIPLFIIIKKTTSQELIHYAGLPNRTDGSIHFAEPFDKLCYNTIKDRTFEITVQLEDGRTHLFKKLCDSFKVDIEQDVITRFYS
jgi:hypothetical protein